MKQSFYLILLIITCIFSYIKSCPTCLSRPHSTTEAFFEKKPNKKKTVTKESKLRILLSKNMLQIRKKNSVSAKENDVS
jgi:hypothetical protein